MVCREQCTQKTVCNHIDTQLFMSLRYSNRLNAFQLCQKQRWLQKRPGELSSRDRYAKNGRPHAMHLS
jgi:hypothetical protein